jgi:rare lipoprotein A
VKLPAWWLLLVLLALASAGCAHHHRGAAVPASPPAIPGEAPASIPSGPGNPPAATEGMWTEEGIASWYGVPFHGHRAADGSIYDMYEFTAAHRTLPFNSVVRVTNLQNGLQTEVRISDRGPFVEGRIIDLSLAAARALDMVAAGVVPVRLEMLAGPNPLAGFFTVQVGAFLVRENAERVRQQMAERYQFAVIQPFDSPNGLFYRVRVGRLPDEDQARQLAERVRAEEQLVPFVVRLD